MVDIIEIGQASETDEARALIIGFTSGTPIPLTGLGVLAVDDDIIVVTPDLTLSILDSTLVQAPTSLEASVAGGQSETEAILDIDGTDVLTVILDTDGNLGATTVPVSSALGAQGVHTLTITQETLAGTLTASADFEIASAPLGLPAEPGADAGPTIVPAAVVGAVRRWVLQDPGGIGSYVFPQNPDPAQTKGPNFRRRRTTARRTALSPRLGGQFHVFERAGGTEEWTFGGYAPTQEMCEKLLQYRYLNRRFWLIDNRNRAWKVVFSNVEVVPRLRHNYNGVQTDWGSDYTVTVQTLDQTPSTPS